MDQFKHDFWIFVGAFVLGAVCAMIVMSGTLTHG